MLEASHRYFNQAADVLNLAPKVRDILLTPNRVVKVEIVEEADDGVRGRRGAPASRSSGRISGEAG